ncbi:hypothetical protein J6590_003386 [Homalodisca vitripennis]|nr:hypothetical protein J6590_003386 [Homalodisca vitripennis]
MNSNRFFIMSGTITEQSRHAYNIYHYPTERQTTPLETDLLVKLRGNVCNNDLVIKAAPDQLIRLPAIRVYGVASVLLPSDTRLLTPPRPTHAAAYSSGF